jgi:hypothetical protein
VAVSLQGTKPPKLEKTFTDDEKLGALRGLLKEAKPGQDAATNEEVAALSATQLRDRLIALNPLNKDWIARINQVGTICACLWNRPLSNLLAAGFHAYSLGPAAIEHSLSRACVSPRA